MGVVGLEQSLHSGCSGPSLYIAVLATAILTYIISAANGYVEYELAMYTDPIAL